MMRLYRSKVELINSNDVRGEQARTLGLLLDYSCKLVTADSMDAILEQTLSRTHQSLDLGLAEAIFGQFPLSLGEEILETDRILLLLSTSSMCGHVE